MDTRPDHTLRFLYDKNAMVKWRKKKKKKTKKTDFIMEHMNSSIGGSMPS